MTDDLLRQGIAALKTGHKAEARSLLMQVVEQDERNEMAWLWLSGAADMDEERHTCLEKVLAINPDNEAARRGMATLQRRQVSSQSAKVESPQRKDQVEPIGTEAASPAPEPITLLSKVETLRKDSGGRFAKSGFFSPQYRFHSGRLQGVGLKEKAYRHLLQQQKNTPIKVMKNENRTWWMFRDEFYWEDEGYTVAAVKALVLDDSIDSESVTDEEFQKVAALVRRIGTASALSRQRGSGSDRSGSARLIARLEEANIRLARGDTLCRQQGELLEELSKLVRQMELLVALGEWMDNQLEAGRLPAEAEVKDHMARLGFATEDIQDLRATPGGLIQAELSEWWGPREYAVAARMGALETPLRNWWEQVGSFRSELEDSLNKILREAEQWLLGASSEEEEAFDAAVGLLGPRGVAQAQALIRAGVEELEALTLPVEELEKSLGTLVPKIEKWGLTMAAPGDREPIPDWMRRAVLDRDQGVCRYCGQRAMTLHLDHVIPVGQGGRSTVANLVTACARCNQSKGGRTPEEAGMTLLPPGRLRT